MISKIEMRSCTGHPATSIHTGFGKVVIVSMFLCLITPLYAATPWLHVDGNKIKDTEGNVVVLRGVDLIDLGFLEDWQGGAINMIDRLTDKTDTQGSSPGWYTKVIRIPIFPPDSHVDTWPYEFNPNNSNLYNLLRSVVDYCASKDIYVIIDWHYVKNTWERVTETSEFWEYMAPKFANDSHVLFELFNEPINDVDGDWIENADNDWLSVRNDMQAWINIVRSYAPRNLILAAGAYYSQIIGPAAVYPLSGDNIVIVSHIYPGHWCDDYWSWWYKNQITTCAVVYPVMMTEWGFTSDPNYDDVYHLLIGTITNYGQPLMDFIEGLEIGNTAWVASYDWGPPMFWDDWTLRCGEGEMGCFVKDTLYEKRTQVGSLWVTKCTIKASKTQGQDSFDASSTFEESLADLNDITQIDVNIVSLYDDYLVYEESIDFDASDVVKGKFKYKGLRGAITSLTIDFTKNTLKMKAKNIDLTGLGRPLQLNITLGSYILSGEVDEDVVNGANKKIPIRLMRTYKDEMRVKSAKAKNSTKALTDKFTVKGEIAVEDISVDLTSEDVVITWGGQTFIIPSGSFTASGNLYKCSKIPSTGDSGFITAKIDLDKCTFNISVKNADLDVTSGTVDFGISFAAFGETAEIDL